jgi:hypothetical protein
MAQMKELFKISYYWLDLLIGFGSPVLLWFLYRSRRIGSRSWRFFWIGCAIGLLWEIPIFLLSRHTAFPIIQWLREPPLHYLLLMISHTLWDGALFVAGAWLVMLICKGPHFEEFRLSELLVLVWWGQVTAFLVEYSAVTNEAWAFLDRYAWNPTLVRLGDHSITAMMQAIWLVASILFYRIALRMKDQLREP